LAIEIMRIKGFRGAVFRPQSLVARAFWFVVAAVE